MNYTALQKVALFARMSGEQIENLFSEFRITATHFKKGEILAFQDEPCNRLIILLEGRVAGEMTDPSGRVVKVEDIDAPNPLAILFLFGASNRFPVQATATERVTALVIPRAVVLRMLSRSETMLENYLDISASFASRLSHKLRFMSLRTIRQKLAVYLLELSKKCGSDTFRLDRTHSALAEYFGVSRQALEREMKSMASEGLIAVAGKQFTIPEKQKLARLA